MSPALIWPYTQATSSNHIASIKRIILQIYPSCLIQSHRLGILHSHTPLDLPLLSSRKRAIDHIQSFDFCKPTNRRKQLLLHQDQIHKSIREVISPLKNQRSRNCIRVPVAQSLLPNRRKLDCLHTKRWNIIRIFNADRPWNSRTSTTSRSSTPSIANSWNTGIAWYRRI